MGTNLEAELQRARRDSVELSSQIQQYKVQIAENVEKVSQFMEFEEKIITLDEAKETLTREVNDYREEILQVQMEVE